MALSDHFPQVTVFLYPVHDSRDPRDLKIMEAWDTLAEYKWSRPRNEAVNSNCHYRLPGPCDWSAFAASLHP